MLGVTDGTAGDDRETTALGAAYLAGLKAGFIGSIDEARTLWRGGPCLCTRGCRQGERDRLYAGWQRAVARVTG